jgi:hypothetical protein
VHHHEAVGHLDVRDGRIGREFNRLAEVLLARLALRAVGEAADEAPTLSMISAW